MPSFDQQLVDTGVNMAASRGIGAALGRSLPIPLPDFYNAGSQHPFADSQFNRMVHGDRNALGSYARRVAGSAIDTGLMATPIGPINAGVRFVSSLFGHPISVGTFLSQLGHHDKPAPVGTVTVGNINDTSDLGYSIDPFTGERITGLPSYMPDFTGGPGYSQYGPYAGGYQSPNTPDNPNTGTASYIPDFSNYSDNLMHGGGSGDVSGSDFGGGFGASTRGDFGSMLPGGGYNGFMNGASSSMMADFAAPQGGDYWRLVQGAKIGQGAAATTHGPAHN